jgi:transcriptional regulator with AAA-type ATPase domain
VGLFEASEMSLATAMTRLALSNPFLPERIALEREVLGDEFVEIHSDWNLRPGSDATHPNLEGLERRVERLVEDAYRRLADGAQPGREETEVYHLLVLLLLYYRFRKGFDEVVAQDLRNPGKCRPVEFYDAFEHLARRLLALPSGRPATVDLPHLFAIFFQIRRAFFEIFNNIIGVSAPIVALRAAVWQSIFGHDLLLYLRVLYRRINDVTTLVTGPSGTGKELVACAIGLSHYIPFDTRSKAFAENYTGLFHALNISALSPTLLESELFGHRRGAFTGAIADRTGWLETCSAQGTVFLDEIGDLDRRIQVKLLRVLQTRSFQPIGHTDSRRFPGKIVAATNRDLREELDAGRFRTDFYYRICSDMITTPTLREQLHDTPGQLHILVAFLAARLVGSEEAEPVANQVVAWIEEHLGMSYDWPGNVRELEQCVLNVVMHTAYHPIGTARSDPRRELGQAVAAGALSLDELTRRYCTAVYARTRNYERAARTLGVDRRTVKSKIDQALLDRLDAREDGPTVA